MGDVASGRAALSRDEVDRALTALDEERERIRSVLLELEGHHGYQLLKDTPLTGATGRRRDDLNGVLAALWRLFEAHGRVVDEARDLRQRHSRPGQAQLAELTRLLTGISVELLNQRIPLGERTLLGPTGEWLTLKAAVERMTGLYEQAAGTIAMADQVWSALLTRLGEVEAEAQTAEALLASLGLRDAAFDDAVRRLATARDTVRSDPLSMAVDGRADTGRLDEIGRDLTALRGRLDDAARIRDEQADRARGIDATIGLVAAAEEKAARARETVLAKIDSPALPGLPAAAATLRDRLAALDTLRTDGRWMDLATRTAELEATAATALDRARTATNLITGLMERRDELRGRLDAYQAKAGRLGLAEDTALDEVHRRAYDLLWASPCDLRQATVALADYQRAITARTEGASS